MAYNQQQPMVYSPSMGSPHSVSTVAMPQFPFNQRAIKRMSNDSLMSGLGSNGYYSFGTPTESEKYALNGDMDQQSHSVGSSLTSAINMDLPTRIHKKKKKKRKRREDTMETRL